MANSEGQAGLKPTVKLDYERIAAEFGATRKTVTALFAVCILASFFGSFMGAFVATQIYHSRARGHEAAAPAAPRP